MLAGGVIDPSAEAPAGGAAPDRRARRFLSEGFRGRY